MAGLWKRFGDRDVVRDVSFTLEPGKVLGLVGPNGSGKTTTIRMVLDIIRPDRGSVTVAGSDGGQDARRQVGYLPEDRGLYRNLRVTRMLTYLGELKGLTSREAQRRAEELLARLGMSAHASKKISELSRGMAQLIQFAGAIIHNPRVVILDEPFAALDPVNVRLMKDIINELRQKGAGVLLSTHQMFQVEELCDSVVMIESGSVVLKGPLAEIKRQFRGDTLEVVCDPWPEEVVGVEVVQRQGRSRVMRLRPGTSPEDVLRQLLDEKSSIERFEVATPSMEEIFVKVVRSRRG